MKKEDQNAGMNEEELLSRSLHYSATIHQPHAIKAYLATKNVFDVIRDNAIWEQADKLIAQSEIFSSGSISSNVNRQEFSKTRIGRILDRGIYPAAYTALSQWCRDEGFQSIASHYLKIAASHNEYLSHNVTIMMSFVEVESRLSEEQRVPFLERVTEFVTSTFGGLEAVAPSVKDCGSFSNEQLLERCLVQPSFYGHNLITLAWLLRMESICPAGTMEHFRHNLNLQATTRLEDPDDELNQVLFCLSNEGGKEQLVENVRRLVFGACDNLHQLTLADALLYLHKVFPDYTPELCRFADYQTRLIKA